jgi:fibronectin type 3 domain-containing protein
MKKAYVLSMAVLVCGFGLLMSGCENTTSSGGLDAPKGLTAQGVSQTGIKLTWMPVSGASNYKIYRTTDSTWEQYTLIDSSITNSTYEDKVLSADTTYYYKVSARTGHSYPSSDDTESDKSEAASATTDDTNSVERLAAPEGLAAQTVSQTSIRLTWTPVAGASNYKLYRTADSTWGQYVLITISSSTTVYEDSRLSANTTYYYKILAASGSSTESAMSEAVSATTLSSNPPPTQLSTPTGLTAGLANNNKFIQLSWNTVENASSYRIYVSFNAVNGTYVYMSSPTDTTFLITSWGYSMPLENGTYYFKVMAYSGNSTAYSNSELSAAVDVTVP